MITNPVVRGFAPDPSMIRVCNDYYLATSSFEWYPSIPIHRCADLASWHYIGSVEDAVPGGLDGVPDSGGIWAPALSHDGERFWIVYSVVRSVGNRYFDLDTYLSTALAAEGPWSRPVRVPSHGFDPSLFHYDGHLYLLNLQNDHRPGADRFGGIVLLELDRRSLAPVGSPHLLIQHDRLIEGPKMVFHDGWFILQLAEGGTGWEHGVRIARSRQLFGPYELDAHDLLTTRDDPAAVLAKAGHGELFDTPEGQWYLSHLAARPVEQAAGRFCELGRETCVQPIVWHDGWPRLAQGGHHPVVHVEPPAQSSGARGPATPLIPQPVDEQAQVPRWPWSTLREPANASWVREIGDAIVLRGRQGIESRQNSLVAQRLSEHSGRFAATLLAEPASFTQAAGIVAWYDTTSHYELAITWAEPEGQSQRGQQWLNQGRRVVRLLSRTHEGAEVLAMADAPQGPVRLAMAWHAGAIRFEVDGEQLGPELSLAPLSDDVPRGALRFTGAMAGLHAEDLVDHSWWVRFTRLVLEQNVDEQGDS